MRVLAIVLLFVLAAFGQIPSVDVRVSNIPGTDTHFTMPEYKTPAEWEARKAHLRRQILSAAGLLPMPEKTPLHAQIFGRLERSGYSIEKIYLETMPGYYLGGNLYRPLGKSGKFPGVLTPHGHWIYGRLEHTTLVSAPARSINLARQGYVVFSYDMVGYNDTIQTPHAFGGPAERLWSFGPLGLQLWNSIRAVDFLESLPDVDPHRLAATGESGGGTQTFLLTAVDDRIRYSAPVNMVSAYMQGGSPCENAPGLRFDTSNLEIAAMMAPRPMLLVSATGDWTKHVPQEEFPAIRHIYELYGKADDIEVVQIDAPHNYNQQSREAVYKFFGQRILGEADEKKLQERSVKVEKLQDMLVLHGRALPENALSYDGLFAQWKQICRRQFAQEQDRDAIRDRLRYALGVEWPAGVSSEDEGGKLALSRNGQMGPRGDRVTGIWIEGAGDPLLIVDPDGAEAARASAPPGRSVLLIDAFPQKRDQSAEHFLTFNRSDDANRVQDILTALRFLYSKRPGRLELQGRAQAAVWCLFAAAVAPVETSLTGDLKGFAGADEDFIGQFFVPGIQRAGGLEAALMLTRRAGPRP
jgi:dienelactone hydrolase